MAMNGVGDKTRAKDLQPIYLLFTCTYSAYYLTDKAPQTFMQKTPEKNRENWARRPLMFLGAGMTARL